MQTRRGLPFPGNLSRPIKKSQSPSLNISHLAFIDMDSVRAGDGDDDGDDDADDDNEDNGDVDKTGNEGECFPLAGSLNGHCLPDNDDADGDGNYHDDDGDGDGLVDGDCEDLMNLYWLSHTNH